MEDVSIKEIDEAAAEYVDSRDNRMAMLKDEIEKGNRLLELMGKHQQSTYEYDGMIVTVLSKTKVSIKRAKDEADEAEE
jgi:flagellar biosynthesis/type III secretory pathway chaperone